MEEQVRMGRALVALRERRGWSQEEAAKRIGVSRVTLGTWERGEARPRPTVLRQLAEAYDVTPAQLLAGEVPAVEGAPGFDARSFAAGRQAALAEMHAFLVRLGLETPNAAPGGTASVQLGGALGPAVPLRDAVTQRDADEQTGA